MSINEQIAWYDETLKLLITIEGAAPNVAYTRGDLQRRKTIITKRRVTNVRKASGPVYIGEQILLKCTETNVRYAVGNCYAGKLVQIEG